MMLKKLFLRKSREILEEVESAERNLQKVEEKIRKLKEGNRFSLLLEEMVNLIRESNFISQSMMERLRNNDSSAYYMQEKVDNVLKAINECLDEMENLSKENSNAISKGEEGKQ